MEKIFKKRRYICICIFLVVTLSISCIWYWGRHEIKFEHVATIDFGESKRNKDGGRAYSQYPAWFPIMENPSSQKWGSPEVWIDNKYSFDYDKYTYVLTCGYTLMKLEYSPSESNWGYGGYRQYIGYVTLSAECPDTQGYLYRIPKRLIEPPKSYTEYDDYMEVIYFTEN